MRETSIVDLEISTRALEISIGGLETYSGSEIYREFRNLYSGSEISIERNLYSGSEISIGGLETSIVGQKSL